MGRETIALAACSLACGHAAGQAPPANSGGPAPVSHDPFAPRAMAGPYGSLADFCAKQEAAADEDEKLRCVPDPGGPKSGPTHLADAGPFRTVVVFATYSDDTAPYTSCNLAVEMGAGWYVDADAFPCHVVHMEGMDDTSVAKLDVEPLVGDHDLVVGISDDMEMNVSSATSPNAGTYGRTEESFLVCAIGASGVPSCTPEIPTVTYFEVEDRVVFDVRPEPGAIVITVPTDAVDPEEIPDAWRPLAGRHPLVFP